MKSFKQFTKGDPVKFKNAHNGDKEETATFVKTARMGGRTYHKVTTTDNHTMMIPPHHVIEGDTLTASSYFKVGQKVRDCYGQPGTIAMIRHPMVSIKRDEKSEWEDFHHTKIHPAD